MIKKFAEFINEDITDVYSRLRQGRKRDEDVSKFNENVDFFLSKHNNLTKNDYNINSDCTVDVNIDLRILDDDLSDGNIPFKFGKVFGDFDCSGLKLVSLKNCPDYVGGSFLIGETMVKSLNGAPKEVGTFGCTGCENLSDLEGLPKVIKKTLNTKGTDVTVNDIPDYCEIGEKIIMNDFKWKKSTDNCDWKEKRNRV